MFLDIRNGQQNVTDNLPLCFRFEDGGNTGNFPSLDGDTHIEAGFLPLQENKPTYDARIEYLVAGEVSIASDQKSASREWAVISIDIELLKKKRYAEIDVLRDRAFADGFSYNGVDFDSDDKAMTDIQGMVLLITAGYSIASDFAWRAANNTFVPMDANAVKGLGIALVQFRDVIYKNSWQKKDAIAALAYATQVVEYDITTGW